MKSHGYNLTIADKKKEEPQKLNRKCSQTLSKANLTSTSRKLIESVYAEDFKQLGPHFGWVEESMSDKVKKFFAAPLKALTSTYAQVGEETESLFSELPKPEQGHSD